MPVVRQFRQVLLTVNFFCGALSPIFNCVKIRINFRFVSDLIFMEKQVVSAKELESLFGLSQQRVSQLTMDGVLNRQQSGRGYDLQQNIRSYIEYLQRRANGRVSVSEEALKKKKLEADIALKESQGELHRLKTSIANGEYISVEEVQIDYSKFFVTFKKFAMNLPSRIIGFVSGQLDPAESRKLEQDLTQEINDALNAFVVAGTEEKPAAPKKAKRGRPKKKPD